MEVQISSIRTELHSIDLSPSFRKCTIFVLYNTCKCEEIGYKVTLDILIKRRVTVHTRREIHFQKPDIQILINENIKSKHLEAVIWERHEHLISGVKLWLNSNKRLHNDILNLSPDRVIINSHFLA